MKLIIFSGAAFFIFIVLVIVLLPFVFGTGDGLFSGRANVNNLLLSEDGGASWKTVDGITGKQTGIHSFVISDLTVDPSVKNRLYLSTKGAGLWKSEDRGMRWTQIKDIAGALDPRAEIYRLSISQKNPLLWFVAVYQKKRGSLLKSEDGGATFREVYFVPLERYGVFDVWQDEAREKIYLATGQGGFLESRDDGKSWRVLQWFPEGILRIIPRPGVSGTMYVLDRQGGLFSTKDGGENWMNITGALLSFDGAKRNQNLAIDPRADVLYLGSDYGLIRSFDGGLSWNKVPVIIPPEALPVLSIAFHPTEAHTFFISAHSFIYKTPDGGTSWEHIAPPAPENGRITSIIFDPHDSSRAYAIKNQ